MQYLSSSQIEQIEQLTRQWLENIVIGLNLCPFAKSVYIKNQVRIVIYDDDLEGLPQFVQEELLYLYNTPDTITDTTLIVLPQLLQDYLAFNDYLGVMDSVLESMNLIGIFQIADFHPDYQFAGTQKDDLGIIPTVRRILFCIYYVKIALIGQWHNSLTQKLSSRKIFNDYN